MIKSLLLKLAHKIQTYYNTIEINPSNIIKVKDRNYAIVKFELIKEIGCIDILELTLHDISLDNIDKLKDYYKQPRK